MFGFQSTLPHGSDLTVPNVLIKILLFQSTLPHGSDCIACILPLIFQYFNPRSLTGATINSNYFCYEFLFQSTLPHGSDQLFASIFQRYLIIFQSTLPHGSDFEICWTRNRVITFQSTLPHGSDSALPNLALSLALFQSTLPHGSDIVSSSSFLLNVYISIHAPSRERQ